MTIRQKNTLSSERKFLHCFFTVIPFFFPKVFFFIFSLSLLFLLGTYVIYIENTVFSYIEGKKKDDPNLFLNITVENFRHMFLNARIRKMFVKEYIAEVCISQFLTYAPSTH